MRGSLPWLEQLRELVNRQGLPPQCMERLFEELSDHFQDIQEEKKRMDAEQVCTPDTRMGEPSELAQFVVRRFFYSADNAVAGVVDQHVDTAELIYGRLYGCCCIVAFRDVQFLN